MVILVTVGTGDSGTVDSADSGLCGDSGQW
jgi:hypothetical protein